MNNFFRFGAMMLAILGLAFLLQILIQIKQGFSWNDFLLLESYCANLAMVLFTYGILWLLKDKFASSLGFLFLGGFFIKLIVFFLFFQPHYKADGKIETFEFLSFFVPYACCLIYETKSLVSYLNKA